MAGEIKPGGFVTLKDFRRPKNLSIDTFDSTSSLCSAESNPKPRLRPPPGTYLVQLPRNQTYHNPPPENADIIKQRSRQKPNRSTFRRCFCSFLAAVLLLLFLAAVVAGILFLVYRPHKPRFSVSGVSVAGINLTSSSPISPVIKIKMRSRNRNEKLGFIYEDGIAAEIFYGEIELDNGEFPPFKQLAGNVTVITTALRGTSILLTRSLRKELTETEKKRKVPFVFRLKAPVTFKVGSVKTWTMTVTVDCKITVDKLTAAASVMTESCDTRLSLF